MGRSFGLRIEYLPNVARCVPNRLGPPGAACKYRSDLPRTKQHYPIILHETCPSVEREVTKHVSWTAVANPGGLSQLSYNSHNFRRSSFRATNGVPLRFLPERHQRKGRSIQAIERHRIAKPVAREYVA